MTGARTPEERAGILVAPALPLASRLRGPDVIDVGSGNGSPGIVLAALRRDCGFTLLEPRQRRWAFLREAARAIGRRELAIVRVRHDGYFAPPAANVTSRALGLAVDMLDPLVAPGGRLWVIGGPADATGQTLRLTATVEEGPAPIHVYER